MKKIIILLFAVFTSLFFSQCSKELDAITPKNSVSQNDITGSDIATLRVGMYAQMEDFVFDVWFDFDTRAVNYKGGPGFTLSTDPINMNPSDADLYTHWSKAYTTLNKINFVLKTIADNPNPAGYNTIKGEALYLRALIYYNLVTRWGGVPILTEQTYNVVPRASEADVWAQIKTDLTQAEILVPATGGP
ncbi:MAG TPA: RagB/SusD family nutrient uptake outer membrane protein, partial [Pedobacter sp.]